MPQTIADDVHGRGWQEMLGEKWKAVHETYLDTLGNLTLSGYNANMSNRRFDKKRMELKKSHVQLNEYFANLENWNGKTILQRGEILAKAVSKIWERPASSEYPWRPNLEQSLPTLSDFDGDEPEEDVTEDYWKAFISVLSSTIPGLESKQVRGSLTFAANRSACSFGTFIDEDEGCIGVELAFRGKFRGCNLRIIEQDRAAIEGELSERLEWIYEENPVRAVAYKEAVRVTDRADWPRQHTWLAITLKRFIEVFSPRLHHEIEAAACKELNLEFWEGFDDFRCTHSTLDNLDLGASVSKVWRAYSFTKWVSLWVNFVAEESYVGVGLEFTGSKGAAIYDQACEKSGVIADALRLTVEKEEYASERYLGVYCYVNATDRGRWPEYFGWLALAISHYQQFYLTVLSPRANPSTGPSAAE